MGIKILADRIIDLSDEELSKLGIDTISCYINLGDKSYDDMINVFPEDIFAYMDKSGKVAQTAAKGPALYSEFFAKYVERGDTVIFFAVSSGVSVIYENAVAAAKEFPGKVFVLDTMLLSNGMALLAKYALRLIEDGETDPQTIIEKVKLKIPKVSGSFLLETLDCLHKGGRCSGMTYYAANILMIKPVIYMNESGLMVVREKHRGVQKVALKRYVKTTFEKYPNPDLSQLYIAYTTYNKDTLDYVKGLVKKYHKFENVTINQGSCNSSVHSGRSAIALFYMQAE